MENEKMKLNLTKNYHNSLVLNKFEMDINEGEINVILGPSGCGKTTLLQCIANLVTYEGFIDSKSKKIGYVFQEDRLFPHLTIMKNLLIIDNNKEKVNTFLHKFNVYELKKKYPHQLSGGEKQRISIIRAFLLDHDLILMDEPFKSLDYNLKYYLINIIKDIQENLKTTIILVTHDLDIAMYLGKYIHVLSNKVTRVIKTIKNDYTYQELNQDSVIRRNELKLYLNK